MIVKTKKYKMPVSLYVKLGIQNILRMQWWVFLLLVLCMGITFFVKTIWFIVGGGGAFICYLLFWMIQFYGVTQLVENRPVFERIMYEINNQFLLIKLTPKQGMSVPWLEIIKVYKTKEYFLLIRSKVQFFYLPFKIFSTENEIKFVTAVLQRKGLLK